MFNYDIGLFFKDYKDLKRAREILNEAGIDMKIECSHIATLKSEITKNLNDACAVVNELNIKRVMNNMEHKIEIWNSLEEAVQKTIEEM